MFHRPIQYTNRHFSGQILYNQIDWMRLDSIIPAFQARLSEWYILPAKELAMEWHNAFSVAALDCLLIDTLSQFRKGTLESSRSVFIGFVEDSFPQFKVNLPAIIRRKTRPPIKTLAEALYFAFRCGILHEAHIPPYCQILPEPNIVRAEASGIATYADATACCAVILDPMEMLKALEVVFESYINNLLDPDPRHNRVRMDFKTKFEASFGINIDAARL